MDVFQPGFTAETPPALVLVENIWRGKKVQLYFVINKALYRGGGVKYIIWCGTGGAEPLTFPTELTDAIHLSEKLIGSDPERGMPLNS